MRRRKSSSISRSASGAGSSGCSSSLRPRTSSASRPPDRSGRISMNRMLRYGKTKVEADWSTNTGRFPSRVRMFVHTRSASPGLGTSKRSASTGCSLVRWMTALRITAGGSGVVEVDDEADPAAGDPDPDAHPVVLRVHQVDVVATAVRLLALEEEVRPQHGGVRVPAPAAQVLCPDVARVARCAKAVAGGAAGEVAADVVDGQLLGVGPRDAGRDPGVLPQGGDVPATGAVGAAARGHQAARPGAVHEAQLVALDGGPGADTDAPAAPTAATAAASWS